MKRTVVILSLVASLSACATIKVGLGTSLPAPPARLLTDSKTPSLSGDKGIDAARFAAAYVNERNKVTDWQAFYCDVYKGYSNTKLVGC